MEMESCEARLRLSILIFYRKNVGKIVHRKDLRERERREKKGKVGDCNLGDGRLERSEARR